MVIAAGATYLGTFILSTYGYRDGVRAVDLLKTPDTTSSASGSAPKINSDSLIVGRESGRLSHCAFTF